MERGKTRIMKILFKTAGMKLKKLYIRYLLSYLIVLIIPLSILTFFYSSRFMKRFYEEIYETVDSQLIQLGTQLEGEWTAMERIVEQLAMNGSASQAASAPSPLALSPFITDLAGFSAANSFIQDIALLIDQQDYIVTSSTTAQKDFYLNRILQLSSNRLEKLRELIAADTPGCFSLQPLESQFSSENTVIFVFPLFTDYQQKAGTVLFFVSNGAFQNLMSQTLQNYQAQLYIKNRTGELISAFGPHPEAISDEGNHYIIRTYQSQENHWTYYAFLPNRQDTFAQVSSIMNEFLLAVSAALLLAGFAIYLLQKANYSPLKQLLKKTRQILPEDSGSNEMVSISNALDYLTKQNTSLSSRLSTSLSAVRNERLFRLLSGKYASRQDFNLDCSELDLYLPEGFFVAGIFLLHHPVQSPEELADGIAEHFALPYVYHCIHSLHPDQIIFLVCLPDRSAPVYRYFQDSRNFLFKKYNVPSTIGLGTPVKQTDRIAQSYMEASSALDYRFIKGNETIITFQEILGSSHSATIYPREEFDGLQNALISRNDQNIRVAISRIISFMKENPMPLYLARSICFDLVRLVSEYYRCQEPSSASFPLELSGIETAQEIIKMLQNWSEQLKEHTAAIPQKVPIERILSYLNANVLNGDFSAYEAAEHFGMTLPAFSKYFKEATGQNVMDFTIHARIQKAKELLSETTLPLKEVAEQVGYYNVSSFTRRFKLNQGVTPGEYRKSAFSSQNS